MSNTFDHLRNESAALIDKAVTLQNFIDAQASILAMADRFNDVIKSKHAKNPDFQISDDEKVERWLLYKVVDYLSIRAILVLSHDDYVKLTAYNYQHNTPSLDNKGMALAGISQNPYFTDDDLNIVVSGDF